jgi:hypothetical protein
MTFSSLSKMMETKLSLVLQAMIHSQSLMRRSHEVSTTTRYRVGFAAQLKPSHERLRARPTRYRVVVLTSWDRRMSDCSEFR